MKTQSSLPRIIKSILKQRELLIKSGKCGKNVMRCLSIIKKIKYQVELYQNRWDDEGWKKFFIRNADEILFLIPENKAGLTIKRKLYESI